MRYYLWPVFLVVAGCFDLSEFTLPDAALDGATRDVAVPPSDLMSVPDAVPFDSAQPIDLAIQTDSLTGPDGAAAQDMIHQGDIASAPDLAVGDMAQPPDLTPTDMARPPDLTRGDMAQMPDLAPVVNNCDPVAQTGCNQGACYVVNANGGTGCHAPGQQKGCGPCNSNYDCQPGYSCFAVWSDCNNGPSCAKLCHVGADCPMPMLCEAQPPGWPNGLLVCSGF